MMLTAECVKRIIPEPVKKVVERKKRTLFTDEFKRKAIDKCKTASPTEVARSMGFNAEVLRKWCREADRD